MVMDVLDDESDQEIFSVNGCRDESSILNVRKIHTVRCTGSQPASCDQCETCLLNQKVAFTKQWFGRCGQSTQKEHILKLLSSCGSPDTLEKMLSLLQTLDSKDFMYSVSKVNPNFSNVYSHGSSSTGAIADEDIEDIIANDLNWFQSTSQWTRLNYLLNLVKHLDAYTTEIVRNYMKKLYEFEKQRSQTRASRTGGKSATSLRLWNREIKEESFLRKATSSEAISFCKTVKVASFTDFIQDIVQVEHQSIRKKWTQDLNDNETSELAEAMSRSSFVASGVPSGIKQTGERVSSARCSPYFGKSKSRPHSGITDISDGYISCEDDDLYSLTGLSSVSFSAHTLPSFKDFIRRLPVHLSKFILGMLDSNSLTNCVCVSPNWRALAEEVQRETLSDQIMREDVMVIQGNAKRGHNPNYAKILSVHVPKLSLDGEIIYNNEAKHIDVVDVFNELEERSMQFCYEGIETELIDLEERNLYCGAYNVLVLSNQKDKSRVTYYAGGKYVPIASFDRRIRMLDVKSGRCEKTISEHVGSVKSVYANEEKGMVLSGSFDTSIRCWDIKTGRCKCIFLGHKSSVICLALSEKYLASGSTDKTVRVWNMATGNCIRCFKHKHIVHAVDIRDSTLLTGNAGGIVKVWDFKSAKIIKSLTGHMGPITCAKFNQHHIVTGSKDCYVMAWSTKADFKRCLQTFRHPKEVYCLDFMYCRIITGSADGKIRLWNLLNGDCLRVIRGNSRNDPITALYAHGERLIVNTPSNLLLYNFEAIKWDYNSDSEKTNKLYIEEATVTEQRKYNRAYVRAQKLRRQGPALTRNTSSPRFKSQPSLETVGNVEIETNIFKNHIPRRIHSAPARQSSPNSSMRKHIVRIRSAVATMREMEVIGKEPLLNWKTNTRSWLEVNKNNENSNSSLVGRKSNTHLPCDGKLVRVSSPTRSTACDVRDTIIPDRSIPRFVSRSRSAPAHRTRTLPQDQRGLTTTSLVPVKMLMTNKNTVEMPTEGRRPKSAVTAVVKNPSEVLSDLKLKSFYQQLQYENELLGK